MDRIALNNGTIFDGQSPDLRQGASVLIEGSRIVEIADKPFANGDGAVFDLGGRTLMPGLIDAHVHVIVSTLDLGALAHEPATLTAAKARRIMEAMLMRGFTSVRDAGGADWGLALAVEQGLIAGPRLFFSGRALSQTGGHGDFRPRTWDWQGGGDVCACCTAAADFSVVVDGVPAVQRAAREELRRGATQIKIMASGGVSSPVDPVWNLQFSEDEIRAAVWEAQSWQTYVMAHAYTSEAVSRCIRFGVRSIEHGNLIDADTTKLIAENDAFLVPTLVTYEALRRDGKSFGFPQVSIDKIEDVREAGLRALEHAKNAGVKIGFGTDLLGETHHYQGLEFSIRSEVLSPVEVLRGATSINAALLNRAGEIGTVAAGALADLIVVDGNPLEDLTLLQEQGKHLPLIMKDGEIVKNALNR